MGRATSRKGSNEPRDVNFSEETIGERQDRTRGTTKMEKMHAARQSDVEEEYLSSRRKLAFGYLGVNAVGLSILGVAMFTGRWYVDTIATTSMSNVGDTFTHEEDWGFSMFGVSVVITYCSADGECVVERDQFRYYEQDSNQRDLQWQDLLVSAAATAQTGSSNALLAIAASLVLNFVASALVCLVFCNLDTRIRTSCSMCASFLSLGFLGLAIWVFLDHLKHLKSLLETNNFVYNSEPEYKWGYSCFCAFGACATGLTLFVLIFKLIRPRSEDLDAIGEAVQNTQKRSKRTNMYFKDIEAGTHIYEHTPVDTFNGRDPKRVGWTQSVDQAATNVLNVNDDPNSRPVKVVHAAIKDPLVNCSMTAVAPMPPRKRSTLGGIINAGTSPINVAPTGFSQQLCLDAAPVSQPAPNKLPTLPGSAQVAAALPNVAELNNYALRRQQPEEELAERLRRGSVESSNGAPNRTRRVCRAPVQRKEDPTHVEVAVELPGSVASMPRSSSSRKSSTLNEFH